MREDISKAIECWASRPTWFSSHPSDAKALRQATANLRNVVPRPTVDELKTAIYLRVRDLPALLGTPDDIEQTATGFASKIIMRL